MFSISQNDENFFRQFITGFVQIWEDQLNLNFDQPPDWNDIKPDLGPHLSRLPDELLPAIGKFLIIAKDHVQNNVRPRCLIYNKCQHNIIFIDLFWKFPATADRCRARRHHAAGAMSHRNVPPFRQYKRRS